MPADWLLNDPWQVLKTVVLGTASYAALIAMLRVSGKRTLSQMNAFDFVVTVALGSTLSAILVSPEVSLTQGVVALGLLVGLQFVVTFVVVRAPWAAGVVKNRPRLLLYRGELLDDALRDERVVAEEVRQAIRNSGALSVQSVHAVILETDGSFSVVRDPPPMGDPTALGAMEPPEGPVPGER